MHSEILPNAPSATPNVFHGVRICEIQHRRHGTLRYRYHHFSLSCRTIWQQATQNGNQFAWQGHTLLLSNKTPVERSVLVIHRSPLGQFIDPLHERERNNFREISAVFATFATVFVLWCPLRTYTTCTCSLSGPARNVISDTRRACACDFHFSHIPR